MDMRMAGTAVATPPKIKVSNLSHVRQRMAQSPQAAPPARTAFVYGGMDWDCPYATRARPFEEVPAEIAVRILRFYGNPANPLEDAGLREFNAESKSAIERVLVEYFERFKTDEPPPKHEAVGASIDPILGGSAGFSDEFMAVLSASGEDRVSADAFFATARSKAGSARGVPSLASAVASRGGDTTSL